MTNETLIEEMTGEQRVVWLRESLVELREAVAVIETVAEEAEEMWGVGLDHTDWVSDPDPLMLVTLGEQADIFLREMRQRISWIEERQDEVEARLRGEWREEWAAPEPEPDPVDEAAADYLQLKALDPEAAAIIGDAVIKAAKAGPGEAARAAVDESKERLAALDARRAVEDSAQ